MTLVAEIDGVALPDGALLITGSAISGINGLPTSAYYGEALTGGIQVDDPEGDIELEGLHVLTVDETACTGAERIWTGWISGRRVSRGPLPYRSGASRVWDVDIIEANWAFALMVFRASSAKRPAETDIVRAQFIIESAPMAFTPVVDNGRANFTDNPINFDESDLVTKYPIEAFNEFVGISGKNVYAYWDHAAAELSLHYDLMGVGPTSTLAISNDIADTDSTTFYPFLDAQLNMTGAWTVTGMLLGYRGAYAYGIRQATIDALSPTVLSPVEFQRDEVYRTDRIGRLATANSTIVSMLEARAVDQTSITVSIRVPASQVNLVEAGDLISFKATHLEGYETAQDIPVIRRTVVPTEGRTDMYDLHLELSGSPSTAGPGGGDPGPFPHVNTCRGSDIELVQFSSTDNTGANEATVTFPAPATAGNLLYIHTGFRGVGTAGTVAGWNLSPLGTSNIDNDDEQATASYYRIAEGGETSFTTEWEPAGFKRVIFCEFSGVTEFSEAAEEFTINTLTALGGEVTPASGLTALVVTGIGYNTGGDTNPFPFPDPVWSAGATMAAFAKNEGEHPVTSVGYQVLDPSAGATIQHVLTFSGFSPNGDESSSAQTLVFLCSGTDMCPSAGVWVEEEVVTLAGANGTTRCPFADGSLHVFIDNVEQTSGLVSQDGTTGDFTLGFDPTPTEVCTVMYQGR